MNRQLSMNRHSSSNGQKEQSNLKNQADTASESATQMQKNLSNQGSSQPSQQTAFSDSWANATVDPQDLFQTFSAFESGASGAISDMNMYRSITPNDTPESNKDIISEPNSDISDGVNLDISIDMFDDSWKPFGPSDTEIFFNNISTDDYNTNSGEDLSMFDDEISAPPQSWNDLCDPSAFDKPFQFDTSLYSMDAE